ncbi:hypothetical protein DBV15_08032 [Temnothorax longispinosus]|uniref:Uncharacterized protein n=1 Tax=Temnothorax longispinosus TaxID=300112 RepID=A0A4S2L0A5_9HYME|nr:hypothetical protein DBV15_08032 [Temnothorax longispinosus]
MFLEKFYVMSLQCGNYFDSSNETCRFMLYLRLVYPAITKSSSNRFLLRNADKKIPRTECVLHFALQSKLLDFSSSIVMYSGPETPLLSAAVDTGVADTCGSDVTGEVFAVSDVLLVTVELVEFTFVADDD